MKKLLVILLLFFVVHGAWAETFYLKCKALKSKHTTTLKFDTIKKTLVNTAGKVHPIEINDTVISWITSLKVSKLTEPEVRKFTGIEEKGALMNILENTLNRHSGLMITELYITSVKNFEDNKSMHPDPKAFTDTLKVIDVVYLQCEKASIKKKF